MTTLLLVSMLTGCGTAGTVKAPVGPELLSADKALIMPPPGGPTVLGVVQTQHTNATEQTVSLATNSSIPGQNYLKVSFIGGSQGSNTSMGHYRTVNEAGLRREYAAAVPGVRMTRSNIYLQNAYGPFAYASGRSAGGDACLFGWQQIRSRSSGSGIGRDFGMVQMRLRLCDKRANESELLSVMYGYTLIGTFHGEIWNPFGSPSSGDPRIGQTGQPIYPAAQPSAQTFPFSYSRSQVDRSTTSAITRRAPAAPAAAPALPVATTVAPAASSAQSDDAMVVPVPPPASHTAENTGRAQVAVPSPDCIDAAPMSPACSNPGDREAAH
ncbi:Hypothetical protein RG1141_PA10790 (plasmid) [Neorhizobium galegae bv. officinalis bv. officinalis str. HAMBI 1141]|uniref:Cellulose biosynthesis protein BcsN n=2 Tax=Neorhizobium galegae TaxID=399 RepID=A0A068TIN8_NEOGA|nr:Hypothetical protein RG1141_PA10790 [Neorhizobium galegae bv. officinalis bv. officinalis str. HAMBI 1141]